MNAIEKAWRLARVHGHHWASDATPAALAYGRAIRSAFDAERHADRAWLDGGAFARYRAADQEWLAAERDSLDAEIHYRPGRPPRTTEEALALSALPCALMGGIPFGLAHTTASGRLSWTVAVNGEVLLQVHRPAGRCLLVELTSRRVYIEPGPLALRSRHVEAVDACLRALGLPAIGADNALLADDQGRTPAWWDVVESREAAA